MKVEMLFIKAEPYFFALILNSTMKVFVLLLAVLGSAIGISLPKIDQSDY